MSCNMYSPTLQVQGVILSASDQSILHIGHIYQNIAKDCRLRLSVCNNQSQMEYNSVMYFSSGSVPQYRLYFNKLSLKVSNL